MNDKIRAAQSAGSKPGSLGFFAGKIAAPGIQRLQIFKKVLRMRIGRDFTTLGTIVSAYLSTISLLHVLHIASTGGCYLLRCSVLLYLCAFLPIDRLISGRCISIARIYP